MSEADDWDWQIADVSPRSERWHLAKLAALRRAQEARTRAVRDAIAMLIALPRHLGRHAAARVGGLRTQPAVCAPHSPSRPPL